MGDRGKWGSGGGGWRGGWGGGRRGRDLEGVGTVLSSLLNSFSSELPPER